MTDSSAGPGDAEPIRDPGAGNPSLAEIIPTLLHSLAVLLSAKFKLLEREFSRDIVKVRAAAGFLAAAGLLAVLGLGLAGAGAALLLGRWLDSPGGGLLIVAAVYLAAALAALGIARSRLRKMNGFLRATREDLKRDMEWLKNSP